MTAVQGLVDQGAPVTRSCGALRLPRSTYYRAIGPKRPRAVRPAPPRALTILQRETVREALVSERFVDLAPREIHARLLDEDQYLCSVSTMYRVLEKDESARERRDQLVHPVYAKPELLATAPNQVWSWDITKLRGPVRWTYYQLYVVLDIYSRYVVAWMLAHHESGALAQRMLRETAIREGILPGTLTYHADRGPSMRSKDVAQLCASLDITRSFSRPYTSDDNPFSESAFKTLKYHPGFPDRFESFNDAHVFCESFFAWYNGHHRHSGIAYLTPEDVHRGRAPQVLARRQAVMEAAFAASPMRFAGRRPVVPPLPPAVWINPPETKDEPVLHVSTAH